jgi:hypothetical protein
MGKVLEQAPANPACRSRVKATLAVTVVATRSQDRQHRLMTLAAWSDARLEPQRQTPIKTNAAENREKGWDIAGSC